MSIPDYPQPNSPGFVAASLERRGEWRGHPERLAELDAPARLLPVWRYKLPVQGADIGLLPLPDDIGDNAIWLGLWRGQSIWASDISDQPPEALPRQLRFVDLRGSAMRLDPDAAAVLAYARAMIYWQRRHRFCGNCGQPTVAKFSGHVRRCEPCALEHYPRSDPSMITLVTHEDACLLGRQANWPAHLWSTLAGFVEPGESVEDAVVREVWEEARITVTGMRYFASQPWPFPASILVGYHASGVRETPQVEQDDLEAADWFTRQDIIAMIDRREFFAPMPFTLSYRLIESWFDQDSPTPLAELLNPKGFASRR